MEVLGREDLIRAARAGSTWMRYDQLWRGFAAFCDINSVTCLPATPDTVVLYLVHLVNSGRGASAGAVLAAVKASHLEAELPDPTSARSVKLAAEGAARLAAEVKPWPRERLPFPVEALRLFLKSPAFREPLGLRDAALLAVGLRLMLRPGELTKMKMADLRFEEGGVLVRLGRTKADQKAERRPVFIEEVSARHCPVKLSRELIRRRKAEGATDSNLVFVSHSGTSLSSSAVTSIVRRVAELAGVKGRFSGHSLRIGGASAALAGGLSVDQVKAVGGWKSDTVKQYLAPVLLSSTSVSQLMGF